MSKKGKKNETGKSLESKESLILNYLKNYKKPFNISEMVPIFHKETGKTGLEKIFAKFLSDGKLSCKNAVGSKIYYFKEENDGKNIGNGIQRIKELELTLSTLRKQKTDLEQENRKLRSTFERMKEVLSLDEAKSQVLIMEKKLSDLVQVEHDLKELSKSEEGQITKLQYFQANRKAEMCQKIAKIRKDLCNGILDNILENFDKAQAEKFLSSVEIIND